MVDAAQTCKTRRDVEMRLASFSSRAVAGSVVG